MPRAWKQIFGTMVLLCGTAAAAEPQISSDQLRQETAILTRDYVDASPSFSPAAKLRAHKLLRQIDANADKLSGPQYLLELARVTAQADNGHDSLFVGSSPLRPAVRLPLRMVWIGRRLYVARAGPGQGDLAGSEVRRIGDWSPSRFQVIREFQGGKDNYRRWQLGWIIHNPAMLKAIGATASSEVTDIDVRLPNGRDVHRKLRSIDAGQVPSIAFPAAWWSSLMSDDERRLKWTAAKATATPLYLDEPERLFRTMEMPELDALYVQFRSNGDGETEKIALFVSDVASRLHRAPPRNLILDLRFDTGGDNTKNRDLMRLIAERVPGRIFLIAGPYTFSAGIASAAALIHDGRDKVTLVGEEMGDRSYWWSEGGHDCLPFSKACVTRNRGKWDVVNGCAHDPLCYGDQFDLRVRNLAPALRAPLTPAAWRAGRDPAMEAITVVMKRAGQRS